MVGVEDAFDAVACAEMVAHGKPRAGRLSAGGAKAESAAGGVAWRGGFAQRREVAHSAGMTVAMIPDQDEPSAEIAALCALVAPTLEGIMPFIEKLNANKFG